MTATKTLSELEILRLAERALCEVIHHYEDKILKDPAGIDTYVAYIEKYDSQLDELEERIKALEGGQNE